MSEESFLSSDDFRSTEGDNGTFWTEYSEVTSRSETSVTSSSYPSSSFPQTSVTSSYYPSSSFPQTSVTSSSYPNSSFPDTSEFTSELNSTCESSCGDSRLNEDLEKVLSRYHFVECTQAREAYSEFPLRESSDYSGIYTPIQIEKTIRMNVPLNPPGKFFLRKLRLYFYITDSKHRVYPLTGKLQVYRKSSQKNWTALSSAGVEWIFHGDPDETNPDKKYSEILFAPIEILPLNKRSIRQGSWEYEIKIQFELNLPTLKSRESYRIHTRGTEYSVKKSKKYVYYPSVSAYFTTCPYHLEDCRNNVLEIITTLLQMADHQNVYEGTEYAGAVDKIIQSLSYFRDSHQILSRIQDDFNVVKSVVNDSNLTQELKRQQKELSHTHTENRLAWKTISDEMNLILDQIKSCRQEISELNSESRGFYENSSETSEYE